MVVVVLYLFVFVCGTCDNRKYSSIKIISIHKVFRYGKFYCLFSYLPVNSLSGYASAKKCTYVVHKVPDMANNYLAFIAYALRLAVAKKSLDTHMQY